MKPSLTRFRCGICNARLREGLYIYSRWTRTRYCSDLDGCRKRARRKPSPADRAAA